MVGKSNAEHITIVPPSKAALKPAMMEPMVVEEAGDDAGFKRGTKKSSRYYSTLGKRFSKFSQIGRAL